VETSRSLSLIETGEQLHRGDEPSPTRAAVLVRLNHGHIRIGSFQRLATLGQHDELARLVDYCLTHYYAVSDGGAHPAATLLTLVAQRTAAMAASFMAAGFVHGVLNTDNINITGESFDYGPWRFAPTFDPAFTAAYFDSAGLYAFGRQAEAVHWNVVQLAIALKPLAPVAALATAIEAFAPAYQAALIDRMLWRLGLSSNGDAEDIALIEAIEAAMIDSGVAIDRFFHDWAGGALRRAAPVYDTPPFARFAALVAHYRATLVMTDDWWRRTDPCSMLIEEVESIWQPIAEQDDWRRFHEKVAMIRQYGAALANRAPIAKGGS
jgi:serine/tyrosine/threonine adenylyltransferase